MTITFPRGSSSSYIRTFPEKKNYPLDQSVVHFMAQNKEHEQASSSTIYDTFAIFVSNDFYEKHLLSLGVSKKEIESFLNTTQTVRRKPLLDEIIDRYFFCRVVQESASEKEMSYLEGTLLTELYASVSTPRSKTKSNLLTSDENSTSLVRALEYIESHLFSKLDTKAIVGFSRSSQATLFRSFKAELNVSPLEYVRNRRLDEAKTLLKSGQYQVSDVALLVGYEDLSSFSKAYKLRFKHPPSSSLPQK
jgi:AraC-like DNA-binding protein